jgi:hypothetical protein
VSDRNTTTKEGKTEEDEMCVFRLTFFVDPKTSEIPSNSWLPECWQKNWTSDFQNIPADSNILK